MFRGTGLNDTFLVELSQIILESLLPLRICDFSHNNIGDEGFTVFLQAFEGSVAIFSVNFSNNQRITNAIVPIATEIIKTCTIKQLELFSLGIFPRESFLIQEVLSLPIEQRMIPVQSNSKSAAKR